MSEKNYFDVMTPMWGRLVGGSTTVAKTVDYEGHPLVYKSGDRIGQPRISFIALVAINKADPEWPAIDKILHDAGRDGFPHLFDENGNCIHADFSFKKIDGDSRVKNEKGRAPCENEGYPGHWILRFSSDTQPKCYHNGRVCDPNEIKPGDYVRVAGSTCHNGSKGNPGVFLNLDAIELVRHGEEIKFRPDAADRFAAASGDPNAVPAWVRPATGATPPVSATPPTPPKPAMPPTPPTPPQTPQHQPDIRYIIDGQQYTKDQLEGWTEAQIATLPTIDLNDVQF